jgi:hypothetical protein
MLCSIPFGLGNMQSPSRRHSSSSVRALHVNAVPQSTSARDHTLGNQESSWDEAAEIFIIYMQKVCAGVA